MKSLSPNPRAGFSLVELLVACALLSILLITLLSITNSTSLVTKLAQRRMDSGAGLRGAMDRLAVDLGAAILRSDLPPLFIVSAQTNGNDALFFHAQTEGYDGDRGVSTIGYRIHDGKLERGAQGAGWTNNLLEFTQQLDTNSVAAANFDIAGGKVFRLKVEFIGTNGTRLTNATPPTNWSQIRALVVNLAGIDSRALLAASGNQEQLADLLPGIASNSAEGILPDWQRTLDEDGFYIGNDLFPPEARRGIEVRQRIFLIRN